MCVCMYMYVCMYVCICVCMYVCMYVCTCIYMCVYVAMYHMYECVLEGDVLRRNRERERERESVCVCLTQRDVRCIHKIFNMKINNIYTELTRTR